MRKTQTRFLPVATLTLMLAIPFYATAFTPSADQCASETALPSVEDLTPRILATANLAEKQNLPAQYTFRQVSRTQKLNGRGEPKSVEELVFESRPTGGEAYLRLVEKNGQPLTDREKGEQDEREIAFRKRVESGGTSPEDEDRIRLDDGLVSRYRLSVLAREVWRTRCAYLISFDPKPGPLPEDRRTDKLLNRVHGKVWVDARTYEITRVEFSLEERVSIGGGLLGNLAEMSGAFERAPLSAGAWLPKSLELRMKGRALLRRFHVVETVRWSEFVLWEQPTLRSTASLDEGTR